MPALIPCFSSHPQVSLWNRFELPCIPACEVQALAMLKGDRPLPWEAKNNTQRAQHMKQGPLMQFVLQLLHRDPERRLSVHSFCDMLRYEA